MRTTLEVSALSWTLGTAACAVSLVTGLLAPPDTAFLLSVGLLWASQVTTVLIVSNGQRSFVAPAVLLASSSLGLTFSALVLPLFTSLGVMTANVAVASMSVGAMALAFLLHDVRRLAWSLWALSLLLGVTAMTSMLWGLPDFAIWGLLADQAAVLICMPISVLASRTRDRPVR